MIIPEFKTELPWNSQHDSIGLPGRVYSGFRTGCPGNSEQHSHDIQDRIFTKKYHRAFHRNAWHDSTQLLVRDQNSAQHSAAVY